MNALSAQNKKIILITGSDGFIAQHLCRYLGGKYSFIRVDNRAHPKRETGFRSCNLTKKAETLRLVSGLAHKKIYAILHLASRFISSQDPADSSVLYDNIKITENLVGIASRLKPEKLINFSSMAVYPNIDGSFNETSQTRPSINSECLYGLSKYCSENILDFMLKDNHLSIVHLRVAQVYGEGMREDRIISLMLKELKMRNTITVYGKGLRISNFISIERLLNIAAFMLEHQAEGIFNVGEEDLSYFELAKRLRLQYGNRFTRIIKLKYGSQSRFLLDTKKIERFLSKYGEKKANEWLV